MKMLSGCAHTIPVKTKTLKWVIAAYPLGTHHLGVIEKTDWPRFGTMFGVTWHVFLWTVAF